jgi:bleomycin hydrolase
MKSINLEDWQKLRTQFEANADNKVKQRTVKNTGLATATYDQDVAVADVDVFSLELEAGDVHHQKGAELCFMYASLVLNEAHICQKLKTSKFSLSKVYLMFYDKLEMANSFYQHIIDTADLPLDDKKVQLFLKNAQDDIGSWHEVVELIEKYGLVPESIMPGTGLVDFEKTTFLNLVINEKLRVDAKKLREASAAKRNSLKQRLLGEIYRLLAISLGTPPEKFIYEYELDHKIQRFDTTPQDFAKKYGLDLKGFVDLSFDLDSKRSQWNQLYEMDLSDQIYGHNYVIGTVKISSDIKKAMIKQLEHGEPIYFGSDATVEYEYTQYSDILDANLFTYQEFLGFDLAMTRDERGFYHNGFNIKSHAWAIVGVHLVGGQPVRWKVKNSWGSKDRPKDGYVVMNDNYLDKVVKHVVLRKRYLPLAIQKIFDQKPILVRYWD